MFIIIITFIFVFFQRFIEQLGELERKVFESYIKLKVVPLVKLVGPGIHGGYFDWGTQSVPKGIRSYLKEILLYFVHVHAEVCSISSPHSVPLLASIQLIGNFLDNCLSSDFIFLFLSFPLTGVQYIRVHYKAGLVSASGGTN